MVDVQTGSEKLRDRARRIITIVTGLDYDEADKLLERAHWNVKAAIVMQKTGLTYRPGALSRLRQRARLRPRRHRRRRRAAAQRTLESRLTRSLCRPLPRARSSRTRSPPGLSRGGLRSRLQPRRRCGAMRSARSPSTPSSRHRRATTFRPRVAHQSHRHDDRRDGARSHRSGRSRRTCGAPLCGVARRRSRTVTVRDLLEHASGLPATARRCARRTRREFEHDICRMPLEYDAADALRLQRSRLHPAGISRGRSRGACAGGAV